MTKEELITKQQLQIEYLKQELKDHKMAFKNIRGIIYCIGGPLNDNKLRFSSKQLMIFSKIIEETNL